MRLADEIAYQDATISSKVLMKNDAGNVTLFAFAGGQELSEHTAPFDAMVLCLEGRATVTVGGEPTVLDAGEAKVMPANIPHAVRAESDFKMLLTMLKG